MKQSSLMLNQNESILKDNLALTKSKVLKLGWSDNYILVDEAEVLSISHLKRFLEKWHGIKDFRDKFMTDSLETVASHNLNIDIEEIKQLWEQQSSESDSMKEICSSTLLKNYHALTEKIKPDLMKSVASSSTNPNFKKWRQRQINRTSSQMKKPIYDALVHAPVALELSKGCSVGCWFCGVAAPKLSDIFFYTENNAKLWREVLGLMKEILGQAAGTGFCYWASDPLDNPDYEKFCIDFHSILGGFPQTTTAQAAKDPKRIKALLELSKNKGCVLNRFSVLSLKTLHQIHEAFTPEELALVKLVLLHEEGNTPKAMSGRARQRQLLKGDKDNKTYSPDQGTIACVTGFLFNMVDKTVKLISPCNASDRWSLGYIVYDEGTFTNASDLKLLLNKMIDTNMSVGVRESDLIQFREDLQFESLSNGFQLSNSIKTFKFQGDSYLQELGKIINKANRTAAEISYLFDLRGVSTAHTMNNLNLMFDRGVLEDEPALKPTTVAK